MTLLELYKKYDIYENVEYPSDKNSYHSYIEDFYEKEFSRLRKEPITLVEIGIANSGSIRLWAEYFEEATIFGVDNFSCGEEYRRKSKDLIDGNVPRIKIIEKDAYSLDAISCIPEADILIDDGPHSLESQIFFLKNYLDKVKKDGIAIVEDIVVDFDYEFDENPTIAALTSQIPSNFNYSFFDLRKNVIGRPGIPERGRGDNVLLYLRKK